MCVSGVPPAGRFFFSFDDDDDDDDYHYYYNYNNKMVSEIFPVVASDQYAEKNSSPNTLHLGPSPSIISKRQLQVSSIIVRYTLHD